MKNEPDTVCPCCGQPVEGLQVLLDENTLRITRGSKSVRFSKRQFKLAAYLISKYPAVTTKDTIYQEVFQHDNGDGPEVKIVDVTICNIRPTMAEMGLVIHTEWGVGYRIVEADPADAEAIKELSVRTRRTRRSWTAENEAQLLNLMKRKFSLSGCAAQMKMPYMTVSRHMAKLRLQNPGL